MLRPNRSMRGAGGVSIALFCDDYVVFASDLVLATGFLPGPAQRVPRTKLSALIQTTKNHGQNVGLSSICEKR